MRFPGLTDPALLKLRDLFVGLFGFLKVCFNCIETEGRIEVTWGRGCRNWGVIAE